ncbi:MAG: hypothetical protein RIR52_512, partial [Acidobacteriota bacterium]
GLKANTREAEISELGVSGFLVKPYTAEMLLRTLAGALAGRAPHPTRQA